MSKSATMTLAALLITACGMFKEKSAAPSPAPVNQAIVGSWIIGCTPELDAHYTEIMMFTSDAATTVETSFKDDGCTQATYSETISQRYDLGAASKGIPTAVDIDLTDASSTLRALSPGRHVPDLCNVDDNEATETCSVNDLFQVVAVDADSLRFGALSAAEDGRSGNRRPSTIDSKVYHRAP